MKRTLRLYNGACPKKLYLTDYVQSSFSQSLRRERALCFCIREILAVIVIGCFLVQSDGCCAFSPVTTSSRFPQQRQWHDYASSSIIILQMAVTPVGPFCPFRSPAANAIEPRMQELTRAGPEFARDLARIQLELQAGQKPDKDMLLRVANGLEEAVDKWQNVMTLMRLSSDFQTREYAKLTQAHLDNANENVENIVAGMKWQSEWCEPWPMRSCLLRHHQVWIYKSSWSRAKIQANHHQHLRPWHKCRLRNKSRAIPLQETRQHSKSQWSRRNMKDCVAITTD